MATNVPKPTWTAAGLQIPTAAQILAGRQADFDGAFGVSLNFSPNTPQGQLCASEAAIISNTYQLLQYYVTQVDPAYATGRMQDAIGRFNDIVREPSESTVLQVSVLGAVGLPLPAGPLTFATIVDEAGNLYQLTQAAVIPVGGTITLPFAAVIPGPTAVPEAVTIYQAIPGWDAVTLVAGVVGQDVESRAAFEDRRQASIGKNARGALQAVNGEVLSVPGVLEAYVTENPTSANVVIGGQVVNPNSIYVAVVGGAAQDVADAIWRKKAPGCGYTGNTQVTVLDQSPGYSPPFPSYEVSFQIPSALPILFAVDLVASSLVPADAATQIQNALLAAFAGEFDLIARASIGSLLLATNFLPAVRALGSWAQVRSLLIGSPNSPSATFTGSISGTTLTIVGLSTGTIAVGQTVTDTAGYVLPGTVITSGGGSSWQVNLMQMVGSSAMAASVATSGSQQVNINQEPTLSVANVVVTAT